MRHRSFTDRNGTPWTVSEVTKDVPTFSESRERRAEARSGSLRSSESMRLTTRALELPWLSFESPTVCRRISSVPPGWDEFPEDELEDLLARSETV